MLGVPRDKVKALVFQGRSSLIASRTARETPCEEIREQLGDPARRLAAAHHAAPPPARVPRLPRVPQRRSRRQHRALAAALPVEPTAGLKHTALVASLGSG